MLFSGVFVFNVVLHALRLGAIPSVLKMQHGRRCTALTKIKPQRGRTENG